MNKVEKGQLIKLAHAAADVARIQTLKYFRLSSVAVDSKEDILFDPVTIADRRAEKAMRELILLHNYTIRFNRLDIWIFLTRFYICILFMECGCIN